MRRTLPLILALALAVIATPVGVGAQAQALAPPPADAALVARARAIHSRVIALDTHNDINPRDFTPERNYTQRLDNQVNLPKMVEGGLDGSFTTPTRPQHGTRRPRADRSRRRPCASRRRQTAQLN